MHLRVAAISTEALISIRAALVGGESAGARRAPLRAMVSRNPKTWPRIHWGGEQGSLFRVRLRKQPDAQHLGRGR